MLVIESVQIRYGQAIAVRDVTLRVCEGDTVGLVGANGAGKSTLLNAISGLLRPVSGNILFNGDDITRRPAHVITRRGVVHVPEGRQIFDNLSVRENLEVATVLERRERKRELNKIFDLFPILAEKGSALGGTLSGGQQQMLAIGRALMSQPKLLMLDEPSLGLAPIVIDEVFAALSKLKKSGVTILMVEQNAARTFDFTDYCYVLERGVVVNEGSSQVLKRDGRIIEQYLATSSQ